jgi:hypothetical protein
MGIPAIRDVEALLGHNTGLIALPDARAGVGAVRFYRHKYAAKTRSVTIMVRRLCENLTNLHAQCFGADTLTIFAPDSLACMVVQKRGPRNPARVERHILSTPAITLPFICS